MRIAPVPCLELSPCAVIDNLHETERVIYTVEIE
jgi:hypothetical protein